METENVSASGELLSAHTLFHTRDISRARQIVSQKFCSHQLIPGRDHHRFETRHNHVAGKFLSLNYLDYGSEVTILPGELNGFYLVQIPLEGAADVKNGRQEVMACPGTASILNPTRLTRMTWGAGCRKLLLQIERDALHRIAEKLVGRHLSHAVEFDSEFRLQSEQAGRWLSSVRSAVVSAQNRVAFGDAGHRYQAVFEEELILGLLMVQTSTISHMIARQQSQICSAKMKHARSFILENLENAVTVEDIASAADTSIRNLQVSFRKQFGLSPMQFLKKARLDQAHFLLRTLSEDVSVASIALSCGFMHLGRFAAEYQNEFGCLPSRTCN